MKKRFTEELIIGFLREAEAGLPIKDPCRQHGFSEANFYLWRSKFGGMSVSDAKRLKKLEAENARLKKLLAESILENEVTREALRKSGERTRSSCSGARHDQCRLERTPCPAGDRHERQRLPLPAHARSERGIADMVRQRSQKQVDRGQALLSVDHHQRLNVGCGRVPALDIDD